jgi:tetratricopeptide (TPR) repeat protein
MVAEDRGQYDEAERLYKQSLETLQKLGDQSGIASTLGRLGRLAEEKGDFELAEIFEKLKEKPHIDLARKDLERIRQKKREKQKHET